SFKIGHEIRARGVSMRLDAFRNGVWVWSGRSRMADMIAPVGTTYVRIHTISRFEDLIDAQKIDKTECRDVEGIGTEGRGTGRERAAGGDHRHRTSLRGVEAAGDSPERQAVGPEGHPASSNDVSGGAKSCLDSYAPILGRTSQGEGKNVN